MNRLSLLFRKLPCAGITLLSAEKTIKISTVQQLQFRLDIIAIVAEVGHHLTGKLDTGNKNKRRELTCSSASEEVEGWVSRPSSRSHIRKERSKWRTRSSSPKLVMLFHFATTSSGVYGVLDGKL
jgi:hypothetical protein